MMLCDKCKKRMAVVFIASLEDNKPVNKGYCLVCAKKLGIPQVNSFLSNLQISDDDLENVSEQLEDAAKEMGI